MKFKDKFEVNKEFSSLFEFDSEKDEIQHDAYMLMFKFLSELERVTDNSIHKKDLAIALNTSRSFISQLFSGNKLANLTSLAKLQHAYNLTFEVKAVLNNKTTISLDIPSIDKNKYESPKKDNDESYSSELTFVLGSKQPDYMQKAS